MKATTILLPGVLLAGGLFINCSSSNGTTTPVIAAAGTSNVAGAATGGASGAATTGGSGGAVTTAGAAGAAGGPAGVAPDATTGKCASLALKHPDNLCYCQPATLTYCPDTCADPATDADHCGGCTTKCGTTQVCNAAKCSATPSVFVPAETGCGAIHLALAGTTLYWTETMTGKVMSISTAAGSTAKSISTTEKSPGFIVANATTVYWINGDTKNSIMKSVGGAAPTAVYTSAVAFTAQDMPGAINSITLTSDGTLYFAEYKTISKIPAAGGAPTEVGHEDSGVPHALSVDETLHLIGYPTDVNRDVDIMTIGATPAVCASDDSTTATNANCVRVARSQGSVNFDSMYLNAGKAYWGNVNQIESAISTMSDPPNNVIASGGPFASTLPAISFGNGIVSFVDDGGLVFTAPLMASAAVTQLARNQMGATSIVADATNAYWATGDCAINTTALKQ